jgi:hypothetical protein
MKSWITIALLVVTAVIAFLVGATVATVWKNFNPDHIVVRVYGDTNCSDPEYFVELNGQTISAKGRQVDFYVMPPIGSPQQITYRIRARYSDCTEILSGQRRVERGWLVYERIADGSIHHMVRAR